MNNMFDYEFIRFYKRLHECNPNFASKFFEEKKCNIFSQIKVYDEDEYDDSSDYVYGETEYGWDAIGSTLEEYGCVVTYNGQPNEEDDDVGIDNEPTDDYVCEGFSIYHKSFSDLNEHYEVLKESPVFNKWYGDLYDIIDEILHIDAENRGCTWIESSVYKDSKLNGINYSFPEGVSLTAVSTYYIIYSVIKFCEEVQKGLPSFLQDAEIFLNNSEKHKKKKVVA